MKPDLPNWLAIAWAEILPEIPMYGDPPIEERLCWWRGPVREKTGEWSAWMPGYRVSMRQVESGVWVEISRLSRDGDRLFLVNATGPTGQDAVRAALAKVEP